ncbi:MAG: BatD family protein, partial [Elusimicrobium sp.]|nr:BatD family protein [Elusimicrobium sp.]
MRLKIILFFAVLFACAGGFAQDIISAQVDKTVAEVNDEILLTVTVSGISADVLSPQLPSMPNFSSYEAGYSASSEFDGKVYVVSTSYLYRLIPRFAGR